MKNFRFSLQSVATLRSLKELRARENLAASIRAIEQAFLAHAQAWTHQEELEQMLRAGSSSRIRAGEQVAFLGALGVANLAETAARQALTDAGTRRDRRVTEYHEAARDLKAMAKLETKARNKHRLAVDREAQNALDERAGAAARVASNLS